MIIYLIIYPFLFIFQDPHPSAAFPDSQAQRPPPHGIRLFRAWCGAWREVLEVFLEPTAFHADFHGDFMVFLMDFHRNLWDFHRNLEMVIYIYLSLSLSLSPSLPPSLHVYIMDLYDNVMTLG